MVDLENGGETPFVADIVDVLVVARFVPAGSTDTGVPGHVAARELRRAGLGVGRWRMLEHSLDACSQHRTA